MFPGTNRNSRTNAMHHRSLIQRVLLLTATAGLAGAQSDFPPTQPMYCESQARHLDYPSGAAVTMPKRLFSVDLDANMNTDIAVLAAGRLTVFHEPGSAREYSIVAENANDACSAPAGSTFPNLLFRVDSAGLHGTQFNKTLAQFESVGSTALRGWPNASRVHATSDSTKVYCVGTVANGRTVLAATYQPGSGFAEVGFFGISAESTTHPALDMALLDWDGVLSTPPVIAILSTYGLHVYTLSGTPLVTVAGTTGSAAIAAVRMADGKQGVAWLRNSTGANQELVLYGSWSVPVQGPYAIGPSNHYDGLVAADFDSDGDTDLAARRTGLAQVHFVTNHSQSDPGNGFSGVQNFPWCDLVYGMTPTTTANTPIAWTPVYNFSVKQAGPAYDLVLPVVLPGPAVQLRIATPGSLPCPASSVRSSSTPHPVFAFVEQSSAAFLSDNNGLPWDPQGSLPKRPKFTLTLKDGWANDALANAIEVTVTRHTGPGTSGNSVTGAIYVYPTPTSWQGGSTTIVLPYETIHADDGQMIGSYFNWPAHQEWFGKAYVFQVRRVRINAPSPTVLRSWETYTLGVSFDGASGFPLTAFGYPADHTPIPVIGTKQWLEGHPGSGTFPIGYNAVNTFANLMINGPTTADPNTNSGPVPLSQRPPPVPPHVPPLGGAVYSELPPQP